MSFPDAFPWQRLPIIADEKNASILGFDRRLRICTSGSSPVSTKTASGGEGRNPDTNHRFGVGILQRIIIFLRSTEASVCSLHRSCFDIVRKSRRRQESTQQSTVHVETVSADSTVPEVQCPCEHEKFASPGDHLRLLHAPPDIISGRRP